MISKPCHCYCVHVSITDLQGFTIYNEWRLHGLKCQAMHITLTSWSTGILEKQHCTGTEEVTDFYATCRLITTSTTGRY